MELKLPFVPGYSHATRAGSNCTLVESKQGYSLPSMIGLLSSNCTLVELKLAKLACINP